MRPEFLTFTALLAALAIVFLAVEFAAPDPGQEAPQTRVKQDYVGITPSEIGTDPFCDARCMVDARYAQWQAQHPKAQILETTSLFWEGQLIGYEIVYRE